MQPTFDGVADNYEEELNRGLSITGDGIEYYARARLAWVKRLLDREGAVVRRVLDFGCGVGHATPLLLDRLGAAEVIGVDVSARSLALARERYGSDRVRFMAPDDAVAAGPFDLAFTNGVFHHIPPAEREGALRLIFNALTPGGIFAFWENNPWNPGTRYIMSRVSFDRDAITIIPPEARAMLTAAGFEVGHTTSKFYFPRALAALRGIEAALSSLPLGGQYLVWSRKPGGPTARPASPPESPGATWIGRWHRTFVFERRARVLAEMLAARIPPGASVLDIGCGDGTIGRLIADARPDTRVEGVELMARPECRIPCRVFDGTTLPVPDASYDVCLFVDVLHHTTDPRPLLREARRVARGLVLIKDHLNESAYDDLTLRFMDWVGNWPHGVQLTYNYPSRAQWIEHFRSCGLAETSWATKVPLYPPPMSLVFGRQMHFIGALAAESSGKSSRTPSADPARSA
jgi:SAM-dependent methyltransferase